MAPHKRAASLVQIASAIISQQLLLLLVDKEKVDEDGKEEKTEENANSHRHEEDTVVQKRGVDCERQDSGDLGNNDLVEILASLGLLAGMMDNVLDSLNAKIGTDKR